MEVNHPKGLTLKMRGRKLGSGVNFPGVLKQKRRKIKGVK